MYCSFFKLQANPFNPIPGPNYHFLPQSHQSVLNWISQVIARETGIVLLTGITGVGKTTLIKRYLLKNNDHSDVIFEDLSVHASAHLAIIKTDYAGSALEAALTCQSPGKKIIYVLDHADQFDNDILEQVFAAVAMRNQCKQPTLLILAGLTDLAKRFEAPCFEVFKNLLGKSFTLPHLTVTTVKEYINYRLRFVGYAGKPLFSKAAIRQITRLSKGAPRMINTLCGNSLFQARMVQKHTISEEIVNQAGEIFSWEEKDTIDVERIAKSTIPIVDSDQLAFEAKVEEVPEAANTQIKQSPGQYIDQSLQEIQQMLANISRDDDLTQQSLKEPAKPESVVIQPKMNIRKSGASAHLIDLTQTKKPVVRDRPDRLLKRRTNENVVVEPMSAFAPASTVEDRVKAKFAHRPKPEISGSSITKSKFSSLFYKASALAVTMLFVTAGVYWLIKSQLLDEVLPHIVANNTVPPQVVTKENQVGMGAKPLSFADHGKASLPVVALEEPPKENSVLEWNNAVNTELNRIFIPGHKPVRVTMLSSKEKQNTVVDKKLKATISVEKAALSPQTQDISDELESAAKARAAARYKLTQQGVPYNKQDFLASAAKGDSARIQLFINAGMPVDIQEDMSRNTALINAVKSGKLSTVKLILNQKPSINQKNGLGKTALMLAVERRQVGIVKALLKNGANPHIRDISGQTARSIAQRHNDTQILSLFD